MKILIISKRSKKQNIILFALILIPILLITTFLGMRTFSVFSKEKAKLPIYCVDTKEKKVAISFDSTWGVNNTIQILDILDKYNVKATFFLLGIWIDKYPEETKAIHKRGHEIGNHSNSHPDMLHISSEKIVQEIAIVDAKLIKLIETDTKLFRFPSGAYNSNSVAAAEKTNHYCIQWDVDSIDWKEQGADIEYNRVIKKVNPGSIILFHNGAKYTPETLERVIKELKSKGYEFVKVSDLIYKDNYYIDNTGKQKLK